MQEAVMFSDPARVARDPFDDAALSLLWPGLGQLGEGRLRAGTYFTLETIGILVAMAALSPRDGAVVAAVLVITLWAVLDAFLAARRAANQSRRELGM
jgi:hypothetical protein